MLFSNFLQIFLENHSPHSFLSSGVVEFLPIVLKKVTALHFWKCCILLTFCFIFILLPCHFFPDFIFSNMSETEDEKGVTRLALTCVQDWGETG